MQAKKVVGMTGLPLLCEVLRSEKEDKEMVRGSLECLNLLVAPHQASHVFIAGKVFQSSYGVHI